MPEKKPVDFYFEFASPYGYFASLAIPFTRPAVTPMNSLAAMRAFYWLLDDNLEAAMAFARAIYAEQWRKGRLDQVECRLAFRSI